MIFGRIFHTYDEKKRPPAAGGPPGGRAARVAGAAATRLEVSVADALINALICTTAGHWAKR